jgi:hypothetical protein
MRQTDASPLTGNAAKIVAITPAGSDQINGLNVTRRLHSAFSYMTLQSTGTHWIITALQDYTITEGTEANVAAGSANTILTLSLSAGSWRIYGTASYNDSGGTTTTELIAGFHSSSNTLPAGRYWSTMTGLNLVQASYNQPTVNLAPRVVHVTGATQDWDLVVFHTTSGGSAEVDMDCSFYAEQIR